MDYYSIISKNYNDLYYEEQFDKLSIIKENFKINGLILDVGAGTGISRRFFKNVILLDKSIGMLKKASGLRVCANAEYLPFKNNSFDAVLCVTVLQNIKDVKKAINEIKRVSNKVAITILKKSSKFNYFKKLLKENFKLVEINSEKDLILLLLP